MFNCMITHVPSDDAIVFEIIPNAFSDGEMTRAHAFWQVVGFAVTDEPGTIKHYNNEVKATFTYINRDFATYLWNREKQRIDDVAQFINQVEPRQRHKVFNATHWGFLVTRDWSELDPIEAAKLLVLNQYICQRGMFWMPTRNSFSTVRSRVKDATEMLHAVYSVDGVITPKLELKPVYTIELTELRNSIPSKLIDYFEEAWAESEQYADGDPARRRRVYTMYYDSVEPTRNLLVDNQLWPDSVDALTVLL